VRERERERERENEIINFSSTANFGSRQFDVKGESPNTHKINAIIGLHSLFGLGEEANGCVLEQCCRSLRHPSRNLVDPTTLTPF
jgi:hypothetical protein